MTTRNPVRRRKQKTETGLVRILTLPIQCLRPSPENEQLYRQVRPDDPEVLALADSVRQYGIKEPIRISEDYYIISGHRRRVAAQLAGLQTVPCIVESIRHDVDRDRFLVLLREHNRQRVKSFDEVLREEIISGDPEEAYQELVEYRRAKQILDIETMVIGERKRRAKISKAKEPFLQAVIRVIEELRPYWPISQRRVHYGLLNDPPLRHASKPKSRYANGKESSKDLSDLITRARIEGRIPDEAIGDDTRPVTSWDVHDNPASFLREQLDSFLQGYWRNLMQSQSAFIAVVGEKATLQPIIRPVLMDYTIPYYLGRGFSSHPPMNWLRKKFQQSGKQYAIVLLLTDHDPDGEVIAYSLPRILRDEYGFDNITAVRVALTHEHVEEFGLVPGGYASDKSSPNKPAFIQRCGDATYELEALKPTNLQEILRGTVERVIDREAFDYEVAREKEDARGIHEVRAQAMKFLKECNL